MTYLTIEEVGTYVASAGITEQLLNQANSIVGSIVGNISRQQVTNELLTLNSKNMAKLKYINELSPLISIESIQTRGRGPFGITIEQIPLEYVDIDIYGYLTYYGGCGLSQQIFRYKPKQLLASYTYGYDTIPDELKMATAVIARTLVKRSLDGLKQLTDYDMTFVWTDDSIIGSDIREILMKYRGV